MVLLFQIMENLEHLGFIYLVEDITTSLKVANLARQ